MKTTHTRAVPLLALSVLVVAMLVLATIPVRAQVATGALSRQLEVGMSGSDVTTLQTLLASNRDIYPEGMVTGYYGSLTEKAVAQFQLAYGLSPVGRVGPQTLLKVNSILAMSTPTIDIYAPVITNVSPSALNTSATISWTTNESARGKVYFDTAPISQSEVASSMQEPPTSGSVVPESGFSTAHSITLSNLLPGRVYHYTLMSADVYGNVSVTVDKTFTTTQ